MSNHPTNSPPRHMSSSSRSLHASQSIFPGASGSRTFLNMLNPMGPAYKGYMQANQSVLEEEDEENEGDGRGDKDLEAGEGHANRSTLHQSSKTRGKRRVSWRGDASEMNVFRPNIRQDDQKHDQDSSDDEVPQNFMIETATSGSSARKPPPQSTDSSQDKGKAKESRRKPLYSTSRKLAAPILPTSNTPVSIPPRPSELDIDDTPALPSQPLTEHRPKQMRGLDNYERALWNWVNVYNLDAFLQEAYYYYEGKGIYSIALSRGLNLLLVIVQFLDFPFFVA